MPRKTDKSDRSSQRTSAAKKNTEIVCGFHAVASVMKRDAKRINCIWVNQERDDPRINDLVGDAGRASVKVQQLDKRALDRMSNGVRHQGVVAEVRFGAQLGEADLFQMLEQIDHAPFILVLDQITDPHNLGACIRTADGAGVDAVVLPKDGAAPVNETVRRVAAGAAERVKVIYVTNLSRCLEKMQQNGIWITGAADQGDKNVYDLSLTGNLAIVMGAEGKGLRRLTLDYCDQVARIPMAGTVSSLNVSVATGVILFEAVRQRRAVNA